MGAVNYLRDFGGNPALWWWLIRNSRGVVLLHFPVAEVAKNARIVRGVLRGEVQKRRGARDSLNFAPRAPHALRVTHCGP
jgi:hypothetical protein